MVRSLLRPHDLANICCRRHRRAHPRDARARGSGAELQAGLRQGDRPAQGIRFRRVRRRRRSSIRRAQPERLRDYGQEAEGGLVQRQRLRRQRALHTDGASSHERTARASAGAAPQHTRPAAPRRRPPAEPHVPRRHLAHALDAACAAAAGYPVADEGAGHDRPQQGHRAAATGASAGVRYLPIVAASQSRRSFHARRARRDSSCSSGAACSSSSPASAHTNRPTAPGLPHASRLPAGCSYTTSAQPLRTASAPGTNTSCRQQRTVRPSYGAAARADRAAAARPAQPDHADSPDDHGRTATVVSWRIQGQCYTDRRGRRQNTLAWAGSGNKRTIRRALECAAL